MRLDLYLVEHAFFESRSKAKNAILDGIVAVNGSITKKCSRLILETDQVTLVGAKMTYVSKGGLKLEKALKTFGIDLNQKKMVDIGSSTGGFCDCALQYGISHIVAIDVGKDQFAESLRNHPKIDLWEETDFRTIDSLSLSEVTIATIDVSFISVTKLMTKLASLSSLQEIICLIKPQFECGKEIADRYRGVVLNQKVHEEVIATVIDSFQTIGFACRNLTFSPIQGGSGNIEYLGYFQKDADSQSISISKVVVEAFHFFHEKH